MVDPWYLLSHVAVGRTWKAKDIEYYYTVAGATYVGIFYYVVEVTYPKV